MGINIYSQERALAFAAFSSMDEYELIHSAWGFRVWSPEDVTELIDYMKRNGHSAVIGSFTIFTEYMPQGA